LEDGNSTFGDYKLNKQFEYLENLFKDSEYLQRISNLEEITSIPFYLLFNKRDVFTEEIQMQDISCCFPDCPKELKFDKNTFLMSPRVPKKTVKKLKSFELIKKPNQELKLQDLSEDELFHIFSFLKARELCELSNLNSVFYHVSNLTNLWKNLCLKFHPDITEEKAFQYYEDKTNFNLWKQYFIHFKMLLTKSEKFLIDKFLSVTNQKFKTFITNAMEDSFPHKICSILDDILKVKQGLVMRKEKGKKNLKVLENETME
jgi:hypothetical protein